MVERSRSVHRYRSIKWLYLLGFLAYLHLTLYVFVNSTFLATILGEGAVGIIYIIGSLFTIGIFLSISHILAKIGNYRVLITATAIQALSLIGLATLSHPLILILLFIVIIAVSPVIFFTLDVFLESYSNPEDGEEDVTGGVRGVYLAIANGAFMLSPIVVGEIIGVEERFRLVYVLSAALLIPFLALVALRFRRFIDPQYHSIDIKSLLPTLRSLTANKNLRGVFGAHYILRLFYAWSIVYLPIYLHNHVGFTWPEIGIILTVTLSPYVLFEIPIGRVADRLFGEKEMMAIGFVVLGGSFAALSALETTSIFPWIAIIFIAEVGAALVEMTTESYFFKQIAGHNANYISLFRMLQPAAYISGIALASALLLGLDLQILFLIFGLFILGGLYAALSITDTR